MLSYLDEVYHTHDAKIPCAAMNFDFSKAFDSVRHGIIVQKFAAFGFDDIFTTLLISYLANRFQCVKVRTSISTTLPVTSGVPQGSVLGPLLFLLFINDLPDIFNHSNCFLFADDSKLICKTNCSDLQSDVDSFTHWCTQNGLKINKTSAISLYSMANFLIVFLLTTNLFILLIYSKTLVCLFALILLGQTILVKNFYRAIKAFILSNVLFHITFHFLLNSCSSILVLKVFYCMLVLCGLPL